MLCSEVGSLCEHLLFHLSSFSRLYLCLCLHRTISVCLKVHFIFDCSHLLFYATVLRWHAVTVDYRATVQLCRVAIGLATNRPTETKWGRNGHTQLDSAQTLCARLSLLALVRGHWPNRKALDAFKFELHQMTMQPETKNGSIFTIYSDLLLTFVLAKLTLIQWMWLNIFFWAKITYRPLWRHNFGLTLPFSLLALRRCSTKLPKS